MDQLTIKELERFDGKESRSSYVAVNGEVYDVSASPMWENGQHVGLHSAGRDLTSAFASAPHGEEVLRRVKKVGVIDSSPVSPQASAAKAIPTWAARLIALHSHPIAAHFPQAFFVFAPLFLVLFYATGITSFERTAYHLLCVGFLMTFPAAATGLIHWRYKFSGRSRPVFRLKIFLSLLLIPASGILAAYHTVHGTLPAEPIQWLILFCYFLIIPIVTLLGRAGGLIVFGGRGR